MMNGISRLHTCAHDYNEQMLITYFFPLPFLEMFIPSGRGSGLLLGKGREEWRGEAWASAMFAAEGLLGGGGII